MKPATEYPKTHTKHISLFLCGDVMTGRGIDQVLPHPGDPRLYEPYVSTAVRYLELAEQANGSIPKPVDFAYVWGDALEELEQAAPDVRLINLETAVTRSADYWADKGVHYRMSPDNMACITTAKIDCCVLANNHVLDWGYAGLAETLETLKKVKVKSAGAGLNLKEAQAPAVIELPEKGRVIVFSFGSETSGIPWDWAASDNKAGINFLESLSGKSARQIAKQVGAVRRQGDIVVASIHWGGNWGYGIPRQHAAFAHQLVDEAGVDIIHGHSSHHPKGIEVYRDKLILYGCGDFLNDYEGISGYESYRDDLTLMYFVSVEPTSGRVVSLEMVPMQIKRFRLNRASRQDVEWMRDVLVREGKKRGTGVGMKNGNKLVLQW
ncbi:MAG: CapA family protein [Gammaproteobacteria bacterium]|nr:MAG: CapA family protein [Gammaproteobacteria bacterium]